MDNNTARRIVRAAMPDAMPRRVQPRLKWLEHLEYAVAVDAYVTYLQLRKDGWPAEAAAECAGAGLVAWLSAHLQHAADAGLAFARSIDQEAPA